MNTRSPAGPPGKGDAAAPTPISVLVVDDHHVVRVGLCAVLREHPGLRIVGEAATAAEAVTRCEELRPDVVLMDIRMPGGSGIEACRWIKQRRPGVRVLFLTSYSDHTTLVEALNAGADGYVLKAAGGPEVAAAVEKVGRGGAVIDPLLTRRMFSLVAGRPAADKPAELEHGLTDREKQVLALIHAGRSNKEIGAALGLSEKTIRNLLSTVFGKLGVSSRKEAGARWATLRHETAEAEAGE